ncbi:MAG: NIPSNAP family protein [Bacteroidota bacterium]
MKHYLSPLVLLLVMFISTLTPACSETEERDYFELKIFHYDTDAQEARLDDYLESAYLPALHRAGISQVGVFKPREQGNETENTILILVPYSSLGKYTGQPSELKSDKEYLAAGNDYIEAPHDNPPYLRIETILLRAFSGTPHLTPPQLESPRNDRVYELRSYQSPTELLHERKVEMFNSGEAALFRELGFNPVFFGEVISSSKMPHLMYMTAHADTTVQKEHWKAFSSSPKWQEMNNMERYKNTVSNITKYTLYPTPYSDY